MQERMERVPGEVHSAIKAFLASRGVTFHEVHHEPTRTSAESARARGEDLSIGGKAIVMKVGERHALFVLSAALRIDSQKINTFLGERKIRFATNDELLKLTGLEPGSISPFGEPITPFNLYIDNSIKVNDRIAFNAGSRTDSIIMSTADYIAAACGTVFDFSERAP